MDNRKRVRIEISDKTDKLLRSLITEREGYRGIRKGVIMEYVDRAILRYIAYEKGILKETTHTQNVTKQDEMKEKQNKIRFEYSVIRARMVNHILLNTEEDNPYRNFKKERMDKIIMRATNCKARSVDNKRKDLLAYGIISERMGEYHIVEEQRQQQQQPIDYGNEKIEGEILSAVLKAQEREEEEEAKANLVLAKFGDLR